MSIDASLPSTMPSGQHASGRSDLIRLPGSRWAIWRCACVRGAGFPAADVLRLSSPISARLANRWLQVRTPRGRRSAQATGAAPPAAVFTALQDAFAAETRVIRRALRDVAADPAFREAVLWQNRRALQHTVDALATALADDVNSDTRKSELLVANYLQRYCVKNDTIGFFGPVGWATFSHASNPIVVTPGPGLLAARNLYFESWCIDAIARAFDLMPNLRPWRVPRLPAFVRHDGRQVLIGSRTVCELTDDERGLLEACDGRRHAQAIARDIRAAREEAFPTDEAVYTILDRWQRAGVLAWSFEGPRELRPERRLQARLDRIDDPVIRSHALDTFGAIASAASAVRAAAGRVEALEPALAHLDAAFTAVTNIAPTRAAGQMYAARTLVYEDCRRDLSVELGADILGRLGPPLSLVLAGARWAVHELCRRHTEVFRRAFDALAGSDRQPIGLGAFLAKTSLYGRASGTLSAIDLDVRAALQRRWHDVLQPPPASRRIHYRSRDLRDAVRTAFETPPDPPSSWARYISPDVMIDAPGLDAIQRGDYQFVLGEIHIVNTLLQGVFVDQHPDPDGLLRSLDLDCPEPRVVWIGPKETTPHRVHFHRRDRDFGYIGTRDSSPMPPERTLRIADLVVADDRGALVVQTRDGRHRFSCLEFFGTPTMRTASSLFSVFPPAPHLPRAAIDDVVICREQWQMPAAELTFATRGDDLDRFVECQRWAHRLELPQYVFVKLPNERKPTYVDLASPVLVDLFARFVRALQRSDPAAVVAITEMLPTHDHTWLTDAEGRRYTSELRIVCVDPSVPQGRDRGGETANDDAE